MSRLESRYQIKPFLTTLADQKWVILGVFIIAAGYLTLSSVLFIDVMRALTDIHIGDIYLWFLIPALWLLLFASFMLFRMVTTNDWSLGLIFMALFTFGLSYFFGFLNWDPNAASVPYTRLFSLQLLLSNISTIFFLIHFELLENDTPNSWLFSIILFLLSPLIAITSYEIVTGVILNPLEFPLKTYSTILTQIGTILVFIVVLLRASSLYYTTKQQHGEVDSILVYHFVSAWFFLIHVLFEVLDEFYSVYNTPWLLLTIAIFSFAYLVDPAIIVLKPTNVILYGVMQEAGLPYYVRTVDPSFVQEDNEKDTAMIAGFISALSSFSKDVAGTRTQIESMKFGDRTLIINYQSPLVLICIASKSNYFLNVRLATYLRASTQILGHKGLLDNETMVDTAKTNAIFHTLDQQLFSYLDKIE